MFCESQNIAVLALKFCLISDAFRFQEQSPDTAAILSPDSGDEDGQEDEDSQRSSQLSLASDESEGTTSPRIFSASPHCKNHFD